MPILPPRVAPHVAITTISADKVGIRTTVGFQCLVSHRRGCRLQCNVARDSWSQKSPVIRLFVQQLVQDNNKDAQDRPFVCDRMVTSITSTQRAVVQKAFPWPNFIMANLQFHKMSFVGSTCVMNHQSRTRLFIEQTGYPDIDRNFLLPV